jgi:hypothetical protein
MTRTENPNLDEVIRTALEEFCTELHTCLPGVVQSYDEKKQTADVQICLKRKYSDDTTALVPLLADVPVIFPRTKNAWIHLPVAKDDQVIVFFSERSIANFRTVGGIVDPEDFRKHHFSDSICMPGFWPDKDTFKVSNPKNIEIVNGLSKISMSPDGQVNIGNGTLDIVTILDDLLTAIQTAITNTAIGPQPLVSPQWAIIQAKIQQLKEI